MQTSGQVQYARETFQVPAPTATDIPLIDLTTQILAEAADVLRSTESEARNYVDGVIGSVPTPLNKDAANKVGPPSTRGATLESVARGVRDLVFEVRAQVNRLGSI